MINEISVVIIAKNAETTINETLDSLVDFNEVILYLNNSTDATESLANSYENVKIIKGEFIGFGPTKNLASSHASNTWILSLDSDEIMLPNLLKELKSLVPQSNKEVFILKRDNYFFNKEVKHSGWGNDRLTRIYNKNHHQFNQNMVHEFIVLTPESISTHLKHSFKHNAVQNLNQFLQKVMSYSDLAAKNQKTCSFFIVVMKAHFAFFKTYFLQAGFLDGWRGFVIAISNFNGKFFRYTKRYINCKNLNT
ncbi:MAG: Putative two-domain glycosyltransferase [uncultured Sulfurovum sp.]|uniref:Two-domain glycosyltransferase n=1 Tax=uncultured Sulfurovum sp. TaxID=269237 RepID=A0A6S6TVK0_9BACT|nr:MAG: Putative two-domain glycosyltransferase [uncultured Sulfurovum sp.]